jgi:hypothetical protein
MRQPQGFQRAGLDDQETQYASQDIETPPTQRMGDQGGGYGAPFPPARPTPVYPPPQVPAGRPGYEPPEAKTEFIGGRVTPVFAWLVVLDGPDKRSIGTVHSLHPDTTNIGRVAGGNQIVLSDNTCSAQHARIRVEAKENKERAFVLYDMGSRNHTYIGDRETYKNEDSVKYRHELQDGDYLLLGETTLVFKKL